MTIPWHESYKIGEADIDAQHRELFARINKFLDATDKASLTACAMSLFQHTREHFSYEEAAMRRVGYPAVAAHVAEHNGLLSRLNEVADAIGKDSLDRVELEEFLSDWLFNHIGTSDARLAIYLTSQ